MEKREKLLLIGHERHLYDVSIHQDRLTSDPTQLQTKGQLPLVTQRKRMLCRLFKAS